MQPEQSTPGPSKLRALSWSTLAAIVAAFVLGFIGSGVFDAATGSGTPNPGGALGAMVGAFAGGCGTLRWLARGRSRG